MAASVFGMRGRRVLVVGAGLAGCAAARALAERGAAVTLLDAGGVAAGASGNAWGVMAPRVTAEATPAERWGRAAYRHAVATVQRLGGVEAGWARQGGALHLAHDERSARRLSKAVQRRDVAVGLLVSRAEAAARCGFDVAGPSPSEDTPTGLWLDDAWQVSPRRFCEALADHPAIAVRRGRAASLVGSSGVLTDTDETVHADAVVVASAFDAQRLLPGLPLSAVRGQLTAVRATPATYGLRASVHYGGYVLPARDGVHWVGSTYGHHDDDPSPRPADDAANLAKLSAACPALHAALGGEGVEVVGRRASVRATTPDRLPIVGATPTPTPGGGHVWVSVGHGSHGLTTTPWAGALLAAAVVGEPATTDPSWLDGVAPTRFANGDRRLSPGGQASGLPASARSNASSGS